MMPLVYIAGPFRGATPWDVAENVRNAERVGLEVAKLGGMPVIPQANTRLFDGQLTDEFWIDGTLRLLEACDLLVMTPLWERSSGARGERSWWLKHRSSDDVFYCSPLDAFLSSGLADRINSPARVA